MESKQWCQADKRAKKVLSQYGGKNSLSSARTKPLSENSADNGGIVSEVRAKTESINSHQESGHRCKTVTKQLVPKGYTVKPIIPARNADLVSVAKAMHREQFGKTVKQLFNPETEAAKKAMQTGIYIGWRCPENNWDCFRVGDESKCFCGHFLKEHQNYTGQSVRVPCCMTSCRCKAFEFIPARPEEVGEFWHRKRPGFDESTWRARCRCKHHHEEHDPTTRRACKAKGCQCWMFESDFLCAACDRHWEEHETFFDTALSRKEKGLPYGEHFLPFAEMPSLRNVVLFEKTDKLEPAPIRRGPQQLTCPPALEYSFTNPNATKAVPTCSRRMNSDPIL
ncbi:protein FAM221B isoform X1 [Protopterus annectens]|uniref:protein FAM221B isoform X1 n=1 Tax=Protopterus annectens TaxID=7888 RepID=UPI001CFB9EE8|nr:protein FAM221B isoform X1 [Protopterus annectens]